ncbi:MAG: TerB family tellurite resistance protein [Gemmatimonadota bacterium]|nr:MAG: TerB family tellurite resistance protein [Gemmatimonadota bacterium]
MSGDWSYAHDLVNMYLGIAHLADSELDPEEQRTFLLKFKEWMPDVTLEGFGKIWDEVLALNNSLGSRENRYALYLQSTVNIAQYMSDHRDRLKDIIRDLVDIAGADGVLHDNEATMIKAAACSYGFSADLRLNAKTGRIELTLKPAH